MGNITIRQEQFLNHHYPWEYHNECNGGISLTTRGFEHSSDDHPGNIQASPSFDSAEKWQTGRNRNPYVSQDFWIDLLDLYISLYIHFISQYVYSVYTYIHTFIHIYIYILSIWLIFFADFPISKHSNNTSPMLRNLSMFDGDFPITAGHCIPFGVRDPDGARTWTWMLFHVPSVPSYPLVMTNIANWKMTIEIVDLPSYKMVIFHGFL